MRGDNDTSVARKLGSVKILSIGQPWAHLVARGSKNIENRAWPTSYRGPVLIYASLALDRAACEKHGIALQDLQRGGIIGIAEITDCVPAHASRWFEGPYGWILRKRKPLPFLRWPNSTMGLRDAPKGLITKLGL
jgi:hypothetical protein